MPLTKSAKKALRTDRTRKAINDLTRHKIKSAMKAARLAVVAGDKDAKVKIDTAYRELDIAAKKNIVHKNKASRLKSRLAKKLAKSENTSKEEKVAKKAPVKKTTAKKK
jgi:small subunit ribosomal protein S20